MMAFEIKPPGTSGTFTTDARDERGETDPSRALTMREVSELRWRFTQVEADLGIRSTFGAQLDGALSQRISDEAVRESRQVRALVTQLRKGRRPKGVAREFAERLGLLRGATGTVRVEMLGGDYIYMRAPLHSLPADPYESDTVLTLVRRQREVDRRRRLVGHAHDRILQAVYGNSTLGDDVQAFRKRFGELLDVAVAIVNSQRSEKDPPARAIVRAKLSDDSFVRMLKQGAGAYLRAACIAYAETR